MSNIFLSYCREDQKKAEVIVRDIEQLGHKIWYDEELTGGQEWWNLILEKIRESDIFAFIISNESLKSQACSYEYTYANQVRKPILPIVMDENISMEHLPPLLCKIQHVSYKIQDKETIFALINSIKNIPPAQPLPVPLPQPPEVPISYFASLTELLQKKTLTHDEQCRIVLTLKDRVYKMDSLENPDELKNSRILLKQLQNRDDTLAKVAREIEDVLEIIRLRENSIKIKKSAPHNDLVTEIKLGKKLSYCKAIQLHFIFGIGLFYVKSKSKRKWIYPLFPLYGLIGSILAANSYNFMYDPFGISACYSLMIFSLSFIDVLLSCRSYNKKRIKTN